jgi:NAD(P)-dependent dehydrogenase (short-subunit alcohol dehydrogenase family)
MSSAAEISLLSSSRGRQDPSSRSKVGIVTCASSGIGLGLVNRLLVGDDRVVANSRSITSSTALHEGADLKLVDGDIGNRLADVAEIMDSILFLGIRSLRQRRSNSSRRGSTYR